MSAKFRLKAGYDDSLPPLPYAYRPCLPRDIAEYVTHKIYRGRGCAEGEVMPSLRTVTLHRTSVSIRHAPPLLVA